jgi:hypothetical protein
MAMAAAVLLSAAGARADAVPASYVRPPGKWHEIAPGDAPVRFGTVVPLQKIFVDDGWTSRYRIEADFADGGHVHYEKPSHAYSTTIPLQQVFYEIYGHDDTLAGHGITPSIADAAVTTIAGRPVAYLARQGKDATCFAFVSQFGASAGAKADSRERMLNGRVCRPTSEGDADVLARRWLAVIEGIVVP